MVDNVCVNNEVVNTLLGDIVRRLEGLDEERELDPWLFFRTGVDPIDVPLVAIPPLTLPEDVTAFVDIQPPRCVDGDVSCPTEEDCCCFPSNEDREVLSS